MSKQVNVHAAKTQFSKLIAEVEAGEEIVIARAGKPILKLVKIEEKIERPAIQPGFAKHLFAGWDDKRADEIDAEYKSLYRDRELGA